MYYVDNKVAKNLDCLKWSRKIFKRIIFKGRLAEELRNEQEHGLAADKAVKTLSAQSLELQARLDDVETTALRHGRKIVAKLEERMRSLESELCKKHFHFI